MTIPRATFRLQFRGGMTFDRAAALAPYWRRLGISHLYASPIFAAVAGSTHGYDVTDANTIDPALGGEDGFRRLAASLKDEGLGIILDFVPNHMAASPENPWWRDVLVFGPASAYAGHFDIYWENGPLTLPFLGGSFEAAAANGELELRREGAQAFALASHGTLYPLNRAGAALVESALQSGGSLRRLSGDPEFLARLHACQHWRLVDWRTGSQRLSYRRFFEITGLVGVRVEDEKVFEDLHAKLLSLVHEGLVDGIRLDHVDGLRDPGGYLDRLRDQTGPETYLVVEKILEGHEELPGNWPVAGATGYEFIARLAPLLTSRTGADKLDRGYRGFAGRTASFAEEVAAAKRQILRDNLASELALLVERAERATAAAGRTGPGPGALTAAIEALAVAMPVYRSYVTADGTSANDRRLLEEIEKRASEAASADRPAIETVAALLRLDVPSAARADALAFAQCFQQVTGPVMAKALEDTAFYRFNRLIALNEVGGDPAVLGGTPDDWHQSMEARCRATPAALNATATHDTKRGEDARARLYALSEAPEAWCEAASRWHEMVPALAPDREIEWMLYQALLGVWPAALPGSESAAADGIDAALAALSERFTAYASKAVREAKRRTSWTEPDADYEKAVHDFAAGLVAPGGAEFRRDFVATAQPFIRAGAINSLAQTALKLLAPGVPDIYQGTEGWDLSLVDPDNRRPLDEDAIAARFAHAVAVPLHRLCASWRGGHVKCRVLAAGLELRRAAPEVFALGSYQPVPVQGPAAEHVVAFTRRHRRQTAIAVIPRLVLSRLAEGDSLAYRDGAWDDTWLELSEAAKAPLRGVLTGATVLPGRVRLAELFAEAPLAMLATF